MCNKSYAIFLLFYCIITNNTINDYTIKPLDFVHFIVYFSIMLLFYYSIPDYLSSIFSGILIQVNHIFEILLHFHLYSIIQFDIIYMDDSRIPLRAHKK